MGNCRRVILAAIAAIALAAPATWADDSGLNISAGASHKLSKKATVEAKAEMRTRNDFRTLDRFTIGADGSYKLTRWLKATVGYQLLIDNNREKLTYNPDGNYNNWRPSNWGTRHRLSASLTGSYRLGRFGFSLRERYQFTYRPEHVTERFDFDNLYWEPDTVSHKSANVLRSRLKVDYDIPASKFTPWASVELFNNLALDKTRLSVGVDYTWRKRHDFSLYYRYEHAHNTTANGDGNTHLLGAGYTFKF